ncbi:hypothetical protein BBK36DRAFT_1164058 [Trichoderma citrinoviride]|uniref:Uncharacterized protein n=1 Tax=Trichoderma citrinoviride TaxID=58853 RepID=A0A2T4AWP5_9HYPO|nr:hypothetical protein BBK36DRAFT_1164058 [Trichoderma citrinoviride]PTB61408.1 hypothetical protein BBK36DRAFT_1164058 [Trichoderma citrinoviride]
MAVFSDLAPMHRRPAEYSADMRQPRAMANYHPPTSEFSFALPSVKEMFPELTSGTWSPTNGSTAQPISPKDVASSPARVSLSPKPFFYIMELRRMGHYPSNSRISHFFICEASTNGGSGALTSCSVRFTLPAPEPAWCEPLGSSAKQAPGVAQSV